MYYIYKYFEIYVLYFQISGGSVWGGYKMDFSDIITGFTDSKKIEQKFENDKFKIVLKSGIKLIRILILFLKKNILN